MKRGLLSWPQAIGLAATGLVCFSLSSCKSSERAAIEPLREEGQPVSYADLSTRVKDQVFAAQEFFFRDSWADVQQAARALQDSSARLKGMPVDEIPEKQRDGLPKHQAELAKAAEDLHEAAAAKDVSRTNAVFQRLNLTVRNLRTE